MVAETEMNRSIIETAPILFDRHYSYLGVPCDKETLDRVSQLNRWYDKKMKALEPMSYVDIERKAEEYGLFRPVIIGNYGHRELTKSERYRICYAPTVIHGNQLRFTGRFVGFEVFEGDDGPVRIIHLESEFEGLMSFKIYVKGEVRPGNDLTGCRAFGERHSRGVYYAD